MGFKFIDLLHAEGGLDFYLKAVIHCINSLPKCVVTACLLKEAIIQKCVIGNMHHEE